MATFGEWLFFEEMKEGVYEESLRRLHIQEAIRSALDFYNIAVSGLWDLLAESEEDEPVELDDPFSGSEDAKPVEETPDDKKIRRAQKIQRMARMVRWAAMLDRRDLVAKVASIWEEVAPALQQNEAYENDDDEDDDWVIPTLKGSQPAAAAPKAAPAPTVNKDAVKAAISRLRPLLEKLGYLDEGEMDYGTDEDKIRAISKAAEAASKETGNDPPDNEDVRAMSDNPMLRNQISQDMMGEIINILQRTAEKTYRLIRRKQSFEGGESKYGAEMDEGDVLSTGLRINMRMLNRREVNNNLVARPWNDDLNILTIDVDNEENAKKIINTIKSPISTPERAMRDERREERKASGLAPGSSAVFTCSDCGHKRAAASSLVGTRMKCPKCGAEGTVKQGASVVSHDAGIAGDDGTMTSMDPVDTRTSDSLTTAATEETAKELVDAFRQAMAELKEKDPSLAILACLWLGIHGQTPSRCSMPDGSVPDQQAANRFREAARGISISSRDAPALFLRKIGLDVMKAGDGRGKSGRANWELVRLIKTNNIPAVDKLGGMPPGDLPPNWVPNYTQRHLFDANQQLWWKYMNRVVDTLSKKSLPFIMRRMSEILAEKDPAQKPKGWESPCSWSITKFLKETFRESIRSGTISISGTNPIIVVFYNQNRKGKEIRSYTITTSGREIKIAQKGWDDEVFSYEAPNYNVKCPRCNGVGRGCSECEGCGSTMDRIKVLNTERDIHARLVTRRINRPSRENKA